MGECPSPPLWGFSAGFLYAAFRGAEPEDGFCSWGMGRPGHSEDELGVGGSAGTLQNKLLWLRKLEPHGGATRLILEADTSGAGTHELFPSHPAPPAPARVPVIPEAPVSRGPCFAFLGVPSLGSCLGKLQLSRGSLNLVSPAHATTVCSPRGPGRARRAQPGKPYPHCGGTHIPLPLSGLCCHRSSPKTPLEETPRCSPVGHLWLGSGALQVPNVPPKKSQILGLPPGYLG